MCAHMKYAYINCACLYWLWKRRLHFICYGFYYPQTETFYELSNTITKSQNAIADKIRPFPIMLSRTCLKCRGFFFDVLFAIICVFTMCITIVDFLFWFLKKTLSTSFQWTIHSDKINGQIELTIASQMVSRIVRCSYKEQKKQPSGFYILFK